MRDNNLGETLANLLCHIIGKLQQYNNRNWEWEQWAKSKIDFSHQSHYSLVGIATWAQGWVWLKNKSWGTRLANLKVEKPTAKLRD